MNTLRLDHEIEQLSTRLNSIYQADKFLQCENMFIPSLILLALHSGKELHPKQADEVIQRISATLIEHITENKSSAWTWNYLPKLSLVHRDQRYPDDMDDTSCAIATITLWKPEILTGEAFASITKTLISAESKPGGPYFTWIADANDSRFPQTPDIGVNANISFMLSLLNISLPELAESIDAEIRLAKYDSQFYSDKMLTLYFISRNYQGKERAALIQAIRSQEKSNIMDAALETSSLIRLDASDEIIAESIAQLESLLGTTDDLTEHPMYIERIRDGIVEYASSEAFVIAAAMEALLLCKKYAQQKAEQVTQHEKDADDAQTEAMIIEKLRAATKDLSPEMRDSFDQYLQKIKVADHWKEVALLPYSLVRKFQNQEAKAAAVTIGAISVFGWIAYTIDDTNMDEGSSSDTAKNIPLSRYLHRKIEHIVRKDLLAAAEPDRRMKMERYISRTFDDLDNAHHAELLGRKVSMTEKSFGHALPAMLMAHMYANNNDLRKSLEMCCMHYILARQLSDDAHDWQEDMGMDRLTDATEMILKCQAEGSSEEPSSIFWNRCASRMACKILEHAEQAKALAEKCSILDERFDMGFLIQRISRYETIGKSMVSDIRKAKEFIASY